MTTSSSAAATTTREALRALRAPAAPEDPIIALVSAAGDDPWSRRSLVATTAGRIDVHAETDLPAFFHALGPRSEPPADRGALGAVAILDYELAPLLEPAAPKRPRPVEAPPLATLLHLADPAEPAAQTAEPKRRSGIPYTISPLRPALAGREFTDAVAAALEFIAAGDVYQVNLTHPLRAHITGDVRALAASAIDRTRAPFAAFIQLPQRAVLSTSPELLVRVTPAGRITARPIKGTRPAGGEADLLASAKDAAELAMIVDLMRNDLGRVCRPGSVRVTEPRLLERHAGVVHTVAEIAGDLRSEVEWEDVLRAVFPAGSITGAPKIRAMQLIGELEPHLRGAYCGSTLWLAEDGTMDLSVNIRTAEITPAAGGGHDLTFGVGAGIVADSDPQAEWAETLAKARGFASAVGASVEPAP